MSKGFECIATAALTIMASMSVIIAVCMVYVVTYSG